MSRPDQTVGEEFAARRRMRSLRTQSTLPPPRDSDFAALVTSMGGRWGRHPNAEPLAHKIGLEPAGGAK